MFVMDQAPDAPRELRRHWPWLAAALGGLVVVVLIVGAGLAAGPSDPDQPLPRHVGALANGAAFALLALFAVAAAGACAWFAARCGRLNAALRETRSDLTNIDDLLDVWQWQSDRAHRLTLLRPPRGAALSEWSALPSNVPIWDHFHAVDPTAFRACLERAAPLDDIAGERDSVRDGRRASVLRGRVRRASDGRFGGYIGTLRDTAGAVETKTATDVRPPAVGASPTREGAEADHESFGYTVSHDLRAPIRVVEGFTKIIKEDYGRLLDRVGNDHLDRVLGAAARMNSMIDALLALSKLSSQPLARQPVNMSQLATYVSDDLRRHSPERNVTIRIEPGLQVLGDPTLLRVLLENLLGNAWKYTGKCDEAHIWLERCGDEPDTFTVRDNGAGFDMRFADRLFGVFQRLHSANDFPGTGVGLASVRRIVSRHGGTIWGEAEVNRGAQFHFSLPQGPSQA